MLTTPVFVSLAILQAASETGYLMPAGSILMTDVPAFPFIQVIVTHDEAVALRKADVRCVQLSDDNGKPAADFYGLVLENGDIIGGKIMELSPTDIADILAGVVFLPRSRRNHDRRDPATAGFCCARCIVGPR